MSPVDKKRRSSKDQVASLKAAILRVAEATKPTTPQRIFRKLVSEGLLADTAADLNNLRHRCRRMWADGELSDEWVLSGGRSADRHTLKRRIIEIVRDNHPIGCRGVFYLCLAEGLVEKTEYATEVINELLADLRDFEEIPYEWITDFTRRVRKDLTFQNKRQAIATIASWYRKDPWEKVNVHVQIWIEKEGLVGVVEPITDKYAVHLMAARGYASISFCHEAGQIIKAENKPTFVYYFGDHDPAGVIIPMKIEERLRKHAPGVKITFKRVALNPDQIEKWDLPSRPVTKKKSADATRGELSVRARNKTFTEKYGNAATELDALDPAKLRALVENSIKRHLPQGHLDKNERVEEKDRKRLLELADSL